MNLPYTLSRPTRLSSLFPLPLLFLYYRGLSTGISYFLIRDSGDCSYLISIFIYMPHLAPMPHIGTPVSIRKFPFCPRPSSSRASLGLLFYLPVAFDPSHSLPFLPFPSLSLLRFDQYLILLFVWLHHLTQSARIIATCNCISGFTKLPVAPPSGMIL